MYRCLYCVGLKVVSKKLYPRLYDLFSIRFNKRIWGNCSISRTVQQDTVTTYMQAEGQHNIPFEQ